jgi:long-chain fatty acid transport protein
MLRKLIQSTVIMTMVQLLAIQVAASASLSLFNDAAVSSNISLNKDGTMELGHWRNSIANRIYPNFYSDLQPSSADHFADALSFQGAKLYFNAKRFNQISELTDGKSYFFTFDYDLTRLQPISFQDSPFQFDQLLMRDNDTFSRSIFAPGIAYRINDDSELSLAVVFAQQNYSDINFLASEINGFDQLDLYAVSYTETSNGLGLNLGMSHKFFDRFTIDTQYQSKIDMDGFSRLLGVQADPADFDIPEQINVAVGFDLTSKDSITFKATHNYYSDINAFVSRSYPSIFLTFLNDLESPDFQWADQTVYAVKLAHQFDNGAVINIEYSGRQQPPATDADLTTILEAISAPYSVRVGLNTALLGGELDLYASYAPKPLNFGRTDFGNVSSELKGEHAEAVLSWLYTF